MLITANRPWPIASSRNAAVSMPGRCRRRCSIRWTSSASAASPSRRRASRSATNRRAARSISSISSIHPGHVDFSYEVSRSLAACEGALLVVDAAQGVEAQSVANCYTALEQGLEVLPVINKIDLPSADPAKVIHEIEEIIGIPADDAALVSAKTGLGVPELLEHLVKRIPPPEGRPGRTAAGAHHRFLVRQLCGRGLAGAGHEWCVAVGRQNPGHVDRAQPRRRQAGPLCAEARDPGGAQYRRGGIRRRGHQGDRRCARGRYHHARGQSRQGSRWRVSSRCSRACSRDYSR